MNYKPLGGRVLIKSKVKLSKDIKGPDGKFIKLWTPITIEDVDDTMLNATKDKLISNSVVVAVGDGVESKLLQVGARVHLMTRGAKLMTRAGKEEYNIKGGKDEIFHLVEEEKILAVIK